MGLKITLMAISNARRSVGKMLLGTFINRHIFFVKLAHI
jgi:hypothetical protein